MHPRPDHTDDPPSFGATSLPVARRWIDDGPALRHQFLAAEPFPHLVLDGFLDPGLAQRLHDEFPTSESMPRSRDYVFGDKRELSSIEGSEAGAEFHAAMTSPEFAELLQSITGFDVFVDPSFHGGGYHLGLDGGYLDQHVDFNVHPLHRSWLRTLNVLLYLNHDWDPSFGGQLLIRSSPDGQVTEIEPLFNRAVLMLTADSTYHGFRRMHLPDGVARRSIATYAYQSIDEGTVRPRTTGWAPESAPAWKRLLARRYDGLVRIKNRFFGSGTADNR